MAYWLCKTEPETYGYDDLERAGTDVWDGVRNPTALKHMRAMRPGDQVLIYHSGRSRAVVGVAEVVSPPRPDPAAGDDRIVVVDFRALRRLPRPVTLDEIRARPEFAGWELLRIPRLSVMPVSEERWRLLLAMAGDAGAPSHGRGGAAVHAADTGLQPFRVHLPGRGLTLSGLQRGLTPPAQDEAAAARPHPAPSGSPARPDRAGPVLLFIHGAAGYGAYWRRLARRLPAHWPLLAPDLRGHGGSDKPESGYDLRSIAADLTALLDAFGVDRAVLVGHSWGGKVALAAAGLYPDRAGHVVAVDPAALAPHSVPAPVRQGLLTYFDTLYGPHESFEAAVARVRALVEAMPGRRWTPESERNLRAALQPLPDGRWVGAAPPAVVRAVLASAEGEDAVPLLRGIRCPVTLAVTRDRAGEFDGLKPGLPPGADLAVEIFDSSHWIPSDRPDELAALLRARLQ